MLFRQLKDNDTLKALLSGIQPGQLTDADIKLLYRWSTPLMTQSNPESIRARQILDVDGIQIQGLLRNCQGYPEKHIIAIVETYFKLSRQMDPNAYFTLLTNAVYSQTKATELKNTLEYLGQNWFSLKE